MNKITESTKVNEMIKSFPEAAKVLARHQLDCVGCSGAEKDNLRIVCNAHGVEMKQLINELNDAIKTPRKE